MTATTERVPYSGHLTRAEMEQIIRDGGSVMHGDWAVGLHRVISRVDDLPTEADLAEGDATKEAAALEAIDRQAAALMQQRKQLSDAAAKRLAERSTTDEPDSADEAAQTTEEVPAETTEEVPAETTTTETEPSSGTSRRGRTSTA